MKEEAIGTTNLYVTNEVHDYGSYEVECDGCGRNMSAEEDRVSGITSCCGSGCVRNLCEVCVAESAVALGVQSIAIAAMPPPDSDRVLFLAYQPYGDSWQVSRRREWDVAEGSHGGGRIPYVATHWILAPKVFE